MNEATLTAFQRELATVFFSLPESDGYLLAGGAALVANDLTTRPTQDLDLFTHIPATEVSVGRDALVRAAASHGWTTTTIRDSPTFCRLIVHGPEDLLVDLALDSPPTSPPTMTVLGPTLTPRELAARKLLALFGRAEARDFADVYVLAQRFDTTELLALAGQIDPGFDEAALAQMFATLGRFADDAIPLDNPAQIEALREFFADWARSLVPD